MFRNAPLNNAVLVSAAVLCALIKMISMKTFSTLTSGAPDKGPPPTELPSARAFLTARVGLPEGQSRWLLVVTIADVPSLLWTMSCTGTSTGLFLDSFISMDMFRSTSKNFIHHFETSKRCSWKLALQSALNYAKDKEKFDARTFQWVSKSKNKTCKTTL